MSAAIGRADVPDLAHPLKFRQAEARWKRAVSVAHQAFCSCGNYLLHFKCCTGSGVGGDLGDHAGGVDASTSTDGENITGRTGGGEGDISDLELLQ
uniref:ORF2 n=1 Tax=Torque teno Leptonychotes weddellii virus-1 TaxID=2012676 RepID=A0A1Z2RVF0_9VIRU|nr:ORF2 [Torque teno Leptonychotes weddellii virus 1]